MPPYKIGEEEPQEFQLHLQYWLHTHKHLYASCVPTSLKHRLPADNKNSRKAIVLPNAVSLQSQTFSPFSGSLRRKVPQRIQHHTSPYQKRDHKDQAASPVLLTLPTAQQP